MARRGVQRGRGREEGRNKAGRRPLAVGPCPPSSSIGTRVLPTPVSSLQVTRPQANNLTNTPYSLKKSVSQYVTASFPRQYFIYTLHCSRPHALAALPFIPPLPRPPEPPPACFSNKTHGLSPSRPRLRAACHHPSHPPPSPTLPAG